jgi:hypothetical protein
MKTNINFYKTIIENDLLLQNINFRKDLNYKVLDLYPFIISIKQILRVLTFTLNKKNSLIYFFLRSKLLKNILLKLIYNFKKNIKISQCLPLLHKKNTIKTFMGFEHYFIKSDIKIQNLFSRGFYLINSINPNNENLLNGKYKINGDAKNLNQFAFFISLINTLIKNN